MEYFNLLEFNKEPFSNSPEPEFLFASPQYSTCLQRLELAVRLRRGLNIVIGEVGTGKTTLCRKLIQQLSMPIANDSQKIETFLLLDPAVESRLAFVKTVGSILGIPDISDDDHEWQIKEKIKNFLYEQGVRDQKNIVLIIDEGQKIPNDCLEILREFLNYETNSYKLLQIIIFAQPEFRKSLAARANLLDRVNALHHIQPLSFGQAKAMIEHRIAIASHNPDRHPLFTFGGMLAVYAATGGYPRKVVSLCHQVMLMMIIAGKRKADWFLVRRCVSKMAVKITRRVSWATMVLALLAIGLISTFFYWREINHPGQQIQNHRVLSGIDIKKGSLLYPPVNVESVQPPEKNHDKPVVSGGSEGDGEIHVELEKAMPDDLGTIALKKKMTIWRVLDNIYGDTGHEITQRFAGANPQIKNISNALQGVVMKVPSMPEKALAMQQGVIMVALEYGKDLEPIYYSFIEKKDLPYVPAIRFLSFWNAREGKQFAIILDKRFTSMEEAREAIRRLPSEFTVSARILSQWDKDTVCFNSRFLQ